MKTRFAFVDVFEVFTIVLAVIVIGLTVARVFPAAVPFVADRVAVAHAVVVDLVQGGVRP